MTNFELMEKVIDKACENGWGRPYWVELRRYKLLKQAHFTDLNIRVNGHDEVTTGDFVKLIYHAFIFDHNFAKAFFGKLWVFHLIKMVLQKDPFRSLETYLK